MKNSKQGNRSRYAAWYKRNLAKARKQKRENMRRYRNENPQKHREQSRLSKRKLKCQVFGIYGTACKCCGFSDIRALTLDHVFNNGSDERKAIGERGVYRRSLLAEYRSEYQILCMNCQFIKRVKANKQNQWLHSHGGF